MSTLTEFNKITDAEAYFEFFQLPYDAKVVNINRLHILKKFSQFVAEIDQSDIDESDRLTQYRSALVRAYETFLTTSPLETKLFKVFNEKPKGIVMLSELSTD